MIGWGLFFTLLIYILGFFNGMAESDTNWTAINIFVIIGWILLILFKIGKLHFG